MYLDKIRILENMSVDLKIIKNYSQALLVSAKVISKENKILEQIEFFANLMQDNATIHNAICSPIIDRKIKLKLVDLVAVKCKFEAMSKQFLYALIKNSRCILLPQIVDMFSDLIASSEGVKFAEIASASKLSKKEVQSIQGFLEEELGKKVELEAKIEPNLIGGVVIKYDSNLIDCSIQGALDRIEKIASKA